MQNMHMQELLNLITAKIDKSLKNLNISIINSCYGARNLLLKIRKEVKSIFFLFKSQMQIEEQKKVFSEKFSNNREQERVVRQVKLIKI